MAEKYLFFDSTATDQRSYDADSFAQYFATLVTSGVFGDQLNSLQVTGHGAQMKTVVASGRAFINGYFYENDAPLELLHDPADPVNPRIDRVVLRLDKRVENRYIKLFVIKGVPAANPVAPALTRDTDVHELSLAQVLITAGKSYIETSQVTDERIDETVCGYVKYQAKPAWYPENQIPQDAWMYSVFRSQLTAQEIAEIEANSTLMEIIKSNEISKNKGFLQRMLLTGSDGDVVISTNTTIPRNVMMYDNLTIDAGVTLTAASGLTVIGIKNTLTLNGTISADGKGGAGGGSGGQLPGGSGGGILIVIADKIEGTGMLSANGTNGTNGFAGANSGAGNSVGGSIYQKSITGGNNGTSSNGGNIGGGVGTGSSWLSLISSSLISFGLNDIGGAGGGGGYANGGSVYGAGGGGGGGVIGNGGYTHGPISSYSGSYTGSGGGGGGAVFVYVLNPLPAVTLSAKGGNGGNAYQSGTGGGGGGGGLVFINAPSSSAIINVSGGSAGTSISGSADAGTAGASVLAQTT